MDPARFGQPEVCPQKSEEFPWCFDFALKASPRLKNLRTDGPANHTITVMIDAYGDTQIQDVTVMRQ